MWCGPPLIPCCVVWFGLVWVGVVGVIVVVVVGVVGVVGMVGVVGVVGLVWKKKLNVTPKEKKRKRKQLMYN